MNTSLSSYRGDSGLKSMLLTEVERHRKADQIIQGTYGETEDGKWRGCAVGCAIHSLNEKLGKDFQTSDHAVYESELGIPEWLARLEDRIFEGLPTHVAKLWPERFLSAIPVGVNLEPVKWTFCVFILTENIARVLTLDIADSLKKEVVDAIRGVLTLHEDAVRTGEWSVPAAESAARSAAESAAESARSAARSAAESARSAARSAAESAAESAWSAAESAARSAAESAAESAWSAAWSAARSAAESAARSAAESAAESAAYERSADELVRLLKASKRDA